MCQNRFAVLEEEQAQPPFIPEQYTPYTNNLHTAPKKEKIRASGNSLKHSITLTTVDSGRSLKVDALIDSGATGSFIDSSLVQHEQWNTMELERPRPVANVDGTLNSAGSVRCTIDLIVTTGEHRERMTFAVTNLGNNRLILGHDWLKRHNPHVDWETGKISMTRCPRKCQRSRQQLPSLPVDESEEVTETIAVVVGVRVDHLGQGYACYDLGQPWRQRVIK